MTIIRAEKSSEHPYTVISDSMLRDKSLSWKARGLLSYILSNYDDWSISISHLTNQAPDGKDSVRSAIDELIEAGYLKREQQRNEKGRITGIEYTVIESGNADLGKSNNGFTNDGESTANQQEKEQSIEGEQLSRDNNRELRETLSDLGVNAQVLDELVEKLPQKEPDDQLREKFLQSLRHDVEEKGKGGGHIVWAIRNYEKYEVTESKDDHPSDELTDENGKYIPPGQREYNPDEYT
jgi:hypothetical protein